MLYTMHHGKIHRATVTQANLEYMGSITIDSELLELSGILPGERVQIVDNNNGNRLETYVIAGERGSGWPLDDAETFRAGRDDDR